MLKLLELVLATLGAWDITRRLLPVKAPVLVGELACVGGAAALLEWANPIIILSLCVPGAFMVLAIILKPAPHVPWGPRVMEAVSLYRERHRPDGMHAAHPARKIGHRIPPAP